MFFTPKMQKAIRFATEVHAGQIRKGKPKESYILHPLSVGLILARADATEDQIVSGILHDTIEDCEPYGSVTKEIIEKEFGSEVARMVNDVTEQDKTLPWDERKKAALEHIKEMEMDSVMLKTADAIQNLSDLLIDLETIGEKAYDHFNAPKEDLIKRFMSLQKELERVYPDNPLLPEFSTAVQKISKNP